MASAIKIDGKILTKNWGLNLAGQALPLLAALIAIPYVLHGLGAERFGLLSIAWAILGSAGLLDLGLGRATTKFVAECLGRGEDQKLPALVWTSLGSQVLCGIIGALLAALSIATLVDRYLKISPELHGEAKATLYILAASFPVVLATNALRGVLEAVQRFDLVNYVRVPASILVFVLPLIALPFGLRLPGIVLLFLLVRVFASIAYLGACVKVMPALRGDFSVDPKLLLPLLVYGGWITVSNFVGPLLTYVDRFIIGAMLSISYVSYYAVPSEAVMRASVIPGSLVATLFPAFASLDASGSREKLEELCIRSVKSLLLLMGPCFMLVISFAPQILRLWLGANFAAQSALVLQILCVGAFFNCVAFIPFCLLQGLGRPDLTAKFHLLEFPFYVLAMYFLLPRMGIAGAALAYTLRLCVDAFLLFGAVFRLKHISIRLFAESKVQRTVLAIVVFGTLLTLLALTPGSALVQLVVSSLLLLAFAIAAWIYMLDQKDKQVFFSAANQMRTVVDWAK